MWETAPSRRYQLPIYGDQDEIAFPFAAARAQTVVREVLGNFCGILLTDGYTVYERYAQTINSLVHARFSEDSPYAPNSPYAASGHFVRAFHETYKLPTLIANSSNTYGYYQFPEKLVPLTLLNALNGRFSPIYGDSLNVRDWLFVEDHAEALLTTLKHGKIGENYNIGGDTERTTTQMVDAICDALESERPAAANPALSTLGIMNYRDLKTLVPDRPGHDRRYSIDITKIKQHLNWEPRYRFENALRMTIRWYLDNDDWCSAVLRGNYDGRRLGLSVSSAS